MRKIVPTSVCLLLVLVIAGCHHHKRETCHLDSSTDQPLTVEMPIVLSEMGFEKTDFGCNYIVYDDNANRTGTVITVRVSQTPTEELDRACEESRISSLEAYVTETSDIKFNLARTTCYFTKIGKVGDAPIGGKTVVKVTPKYPGLVVIISGLWGSEHQKLMLKTFNLFAKDVSVRPRKETE